MKKIMSIALVSLITFNGFAQKKKSAAAPVPVPTEASTPSVAKQEAVSSSPAAETVVQPITDEQKVKQKAITKEFKEAKAKIEADTTLTPELKQAKIKEASKEKSKKMKEVFTPEQLQKMKEDAKKKAEKE